MMRKWAMPWYNKAFVSIFRFHSFVVLFVIYILVQYISSLRSFIPIENIITSHWNHPTFKLVICYLHIIAKSISSLYLLENYIDRCAPVVGRYAGVMATSNPIFLQVWRHEDIRKVLFRYMDDDTLCALRLTGSEFCRLATSTLFTRTRLTFTPSALTRPSRLEALSRIGHHIQHLTFSMPHTSSTFLPPLLNPLTGREVTFLYTPHTSLASESHRPKYGNQELGDVLTQQYPPIFHAATNVPAFIRALRCMPKLRHLTVSTPGQDPTQRYRRDAVDYALISLRIAIEHAPLLRLQKLSLNVIHPSGLVYFRHMPGFGSSPAAGRRWRQIRKLKVAVESWDFNGPRPGLDHLKIIDDFIRGFSPTLEKVSFTWVGRKGPCPLTLPSSPQFAPPRRTAKLFAEVTSPMSPLPAAPPRPAMHFPKLRYMQIRNSLMATKQVADLVYNHRHTVREFDFQNVTLANEGTWEEALEPLTRMSGSEAWQSQHGGSDSGGYQTCPSQAATSPANSHVEVNAILDGKRDSIVVTKLRKRRVRRRRKQKDAPSEAGSSRPNISAPYISAPIISAPIISAPIISAPIIPEPVVELLQPMTFDPNVQGVQRNLAMEESQQQLVDDVDKRVSTLRKAREAVLTRLGNQFCKSQIREQPKGIFGRMGKGQMRSDSSTQLVPLMIFR